jgi:hypothetical protein
MVLALVMAQRATPHVRAVDFLILFASGVFFGVSLITRITKTFVRQQGSWLLAALHSSEIGQR